MTDDERTNSFAKSDLTRQLRSKSRRRREAATRLAETTAATRTRRNDLLPPLEVISMALDELRAPKRNVRKSDEAHIRGIADSIEVLGVCEPVLIGDDNEIIDGVLKVAAARLLNLTHFPVIRIGHLNKVNDAHCVWR